MSIAVDAFRASLDEIVRAEPWGDGELLVTPWEFSDHEPIVLYVRDVHGTYVVSDRGQASDNLGLAGVDLHKASVKRSWEAVQRSLESDPFVFRIPSLWELAARANTEADLGLTINQVAEAAMRADGLRASAGARNNAPRFDAWVIGEAMARGLSVVPRAEISSTVGVKRRISALIEGSRKAYVQALGPSQDPWDSYDRARSLFSDTLIDQKERFTVISRESSLTVEQIRGIGQHSEVVDERNLPELLAAVA